MSETASVPPPRQRKCVLRAIGLAVIVLVLLAAAGVWWALGTTSGANVIFGRVANALGEGTRIEGVEGRIGGPLRFATIEIDRPDLYVRVEGVDMDTSARPGRLTVHRLHARNVIVRTYSTGAAASIPASFAPPYPVRLEDGLVTRLAVGKISEAEHAAKDAAARQAARAESAKSDIVLRDIVLKGEGDKSRWKIDEAAVATDYGRARLAGTLGNAAPFAVDLHADASGDFQQKAYRVDGRLGGSLKALDASADGEYSGTRAQAHASLTPFETPPLRALDLTAHEVDLAHFGEGLPATRLEVEAKLEPRGAGFAGPVRVANAQPGRWDEKRLPFTQAHANVAAAAERVDVTGLELALVAGGAARGRVTVEHAHVTADLQVADVDLAALDRGLQKTRIAGHIAASGDGAAQKFEVALKDPRFQVEGRGQAANQRLTIETVRITTGGGVLDAKGGMALAGQKDFAFEGRAQHFDPSAFVSTKKGELNFAFATRGTLAGAAGVAGEASLDIAPSTFAGLPLQGRARVSGDRTRLASSDIDLVVGENKVQAKGSFGRTGDALDVAFDAPNLAQLARPFNVALGGRAQGTARLTGTIEAPAGRVNVTASNLALPTQVTIAQLEVRGEAGIAPTSPIDASVRAARIVNTKVTPPETVVESVDATLAGTRLEHRLVVQSAVTKQSSFHATLHGGEQRSGKAPAWDGRLEAFGITGPGAFEITAPAALHVSASRIELDDTRMRGEWGAARLELTRWTPRGIEIKGASDGIEIRSLARSLKLANVSRSDLVVAGSWDIRALETFDGSLDLHRVRGDLRVGDPPLPLELQDLVLRMEAARGRTRGELSFVGARIGRVQGQGTGLVVRGQQGWQFASTAPIDAKVVAHVADLSLLAPWLGTDAKLAGSIDANIAVSGTGANPAVAGDVRASQLAVREPQSGFEIERGEVSLKLAGHTLSIERLEARTPWHPPARAQEHFRRVQAPAGGGTLSATGAIDVAQRTGAITLHADHAVATQLTSRFLALSGDAKVTAAQDGLSVTGTLRADAGWIGALEEAPPSPSDDVVVIRTSQPESQAGASKEPMHLDLRLGLGERVWFEGRGLDTRLAGDLHLVGDVGGALRAEGVIRTLGGTYNGYGQKLAIERGVLTFNGPIDNPQLNVLALRKGLPVEAGVEVLGSTARPRVRLVSTPDVPEPEKLSWLVLGRGASDATLGDSAVLMAAARALMGNNNPGSDLTRKLGFDEIKIGKSDTNSVLGVLPQNTVAGRTGQPAATDVVSVGKRINNRIQLNYEQGLADAEGTLKIAYRVSRQFHLLARVGYLPGLDAVYRWTFK